MRWMDVFVTHYRQVIICLEELDSICHTRNPNACLLHSVCHCLPPSLHLVQTLNPFATANHFYVHRAGSYDVQTGLALCYCFS